LNCSNRHRQARVDGLDFRVRPLETIEPEKLTQKDLDELQYNLAHLRLDAVRRFYEPADEDCHMIYDRHIASR
jgi:hypothetical protein